MGKANIMKIKLGVIVFLIIPIVIFCADSYDGLVKRGVFYMQLKKLDEAIEYFQESISIDSHRFEAYYYLGNTYFQEGKNKKAQENFEKAIGTFPENPTDSNERVNLAQCHYTLAFVFLAEDEPQKALEAFEKCISLAPQSLVGKLALKEKKKIEEEIKYQGRILKPSP
jgi:tetratricopeptide (TPR) repeat protein